MPRFFCPTALIPGALLDLPAGAARHVQVLRLQPGAEITLFNAESSRAGPASGEFAATITRMERNGVQVHVGAWQPGVPEAALCVHLGVGMPANERMDWLVEKAVELGAASIAPLLTERSVLRPKAERADKKVTHWQGIAVAACEQCGGNRVPKLHPVLALSDWLRQLGAPRTSHLRLLLALRTVAIRLPVAAAARDVTDITMLSGPEGGLSRSEEDAALAAGFVPVTLGQRVLRAETAALAALAALLIAA